MKLIPLKTDYFEFKNSEPSPLPPLVCDFVLLTAEAITLQDVRIAPDANGTYLTTGKEVFWGFAGNHSHSLYLGEKSFLIPVENLNQITVRVNTPAAGQIVAFSCFKEAKKEKI